MEPNELELLKKVLPEGYTYEQRNMRTAFVILDEEGDVYLQGVSTTARGVVLELMEQARHHGNTEGRTKAQHEVRTSLGLIEVLREIRDEINELKSR
jgi:hypothetical protein